MRKNQQVNFFSDRRTIVSVLKIAQLVRSTELSIHPCSKEQWAERGIVDESLSNGSPQVIGSLNGVEHPPLL